MPITEKQREARRKHLGATDIAEILCGDPYKVWLSKHYDLEDNPTPAMRIGTILENAILTWAQADAGIKIAKRNQYRILRDASVPIGTHIDAIDIASTPVEAKSAGITSDYTDLSEWGEAETDQVPFRVIIQCHVHMMALQKDECFVPALLGGRGFALYKVGCNETICKHIINAAITFWTSHIINSDPPISRNFQAVLPILKRIRRIPEKTIQLEDSNLVDEWLCSKAKRLGQAREEQTALARILDVLGDAEAAELPDGRMFTYVQQTRRGYTVGPKTFRVPRIIQERRLTHDGNRQGQNQEHS